MTPNFKQKHSIDDLVHYVTLHKILPLALRAIVWPFVVFYLICLGFIYQTDPENYEIGLIALAIVGCFHILTVLCCYWSVHIAAFLNCRKVKFELPQQNVFAKVVPMPNNGSPEMVQIYSTQLNNAEQQVISWFVFQKIKYVWDANKKTFRGIDFPINKTYGEYMNSKGHQSEETVELANKRYGNNQMEMVVPEFMALFIERATAPFFVFQIFSVGLWCLDQYVYYSLFTLFMLVIFECTLVQQQLRNMAEIRKMGNKPSLINVYRNNKWRQIMSDQLTPGDLISVGRSKNDTFVPCDVVLLRGSCIVDESMLTGESVPQIKESLEATDEIQRELDPESDGKLFVLFGGTKVVQHTPPTKVSLRAPDDGCIAYVIRTGFNTSQGKLLRTILFGVKRVTENNSETFAFILFLLIFALSAASYVWIKGTEDLERSRYKLFLECTLILTSIIPPDLPIELSLAVNTSLIKLAKLYVFCTEPFRIPLAGKVQICCFDKTGTLTSDDLLVEGIAGLSDSTSDIVSIADASEKTVSVLATCHSLAQLDDGLVGDPLEKATLTAIDWNLTKQDSVIPKKAKFKAMKIYQRFYFSSALKRMSVLAGYLVQFTNEVNYIGTVKGAPEVVMKMLKSVPENYQKTYLEFSRRGARVLALAYKEFGTLDAQSAREIKREDVEKDLEFAGFVIISCPLKSDSKSAIKEIVKSTHKVVMITGDNPLTACHVAKELRFTRKTILVLSQDIQNTEDDKPKYIWISINEDQVEQIDGKAWKSLVQNYDLAITGEGLQYLCDYQYQYFQKIAPYITVYARFAPKQKEFIITTLKSLGYFTLMCGDGTNDVGALKHAHVGVSILSNASIKKRKVKPDNALSLSSGSIIPPAGGNTAAQNRIRGANDRSASSMTPRERAIAKHREQSQALINKALKDIEEDQVQIVKLGDASIAAPFTSKTSSINCVTNIIKQGRCTLVTTLQMFKILALNALISAYCQSVLYIDGFKFSDTQATLQGIFIAACFLFIIKSKPLKVLSKEAPLPNIFNLYTISSILLQFAVHFTALVYLTSEATARSPPREGKVKLNIDLAPGEEEEAFKANIINSTVFIICFALQVSTFAVNHKGHPFMERLRENKFLMYTIAVSSAVIVALSFGLSSSLNETFEIVEFPEEFKQILVRVLIADTVLAFAVDRICSFLFGSIRRSDILSD
ncbi:manganese-transporting ATPase 13A1 [Contarinia nasturtii]|uniref:manganese-transporting ATPase 13A1 n=1 Tax=Contarinia nasturtii TaxID=265458 RepID=UPI0012D4A9C9|nr:manganese-transporting ATPase 13A1 [Contarinia nasturtii]